MSGEATATRTSYAYAPYAQKQCSQEFVENYDDVMTLAIIKIYSKNKVLY